MRGSDKRSGSLFSYVDLEARVRRDHPLRAIRHFADGALEALTVGFGELYSSTGRPSIPPEMLLRAMLLQAFYTIRSERQLMERMEFDCCFAGSLACRSTIRSGITRCSQKTAIGSSRAMPRRSSSMRFWLSRE